MRRCGGSSGGAGRAGGRIALAALGALSGAAPAAALAQSGDGFLFKPPVVRLAMYGGFAVPKASSDLFDFTRENLTVAGSDFNAGAFGGSIGVRVHERVDLTFDVSRARARTRSEFRDFVDQDDLPIAQTTTFRRVPVTFGLKGYLKDRGRSVSRFAWIPERWNAFAGAAGGWTFYEFEQRGDFVDFETLDIFREEFRSDGATGTFQLFGGVERSLGARFVLTAEGRYSWASAELDGDFVGFDRLDLAGFQISAGVAVRF